ncbi:uncharacterized protein G2W53_012120 [Senna tora]|uniref:Uncharacterized protein n=1 Tax=Senna tora TaxID=362788 RepID=A0A834TX63_9FABA|nr:uncharacterized protein G2W53_012120 [Senna tora]
MEGEKKMKNEKRERSWEKEKGSVFPVKGSSVKKKMWDRIVGAFTHNRKAST